VKRRTFHKHDQGRISWGFHIPLNICKVSLDNPPSLPLTVGWLDGWPEVGHLQSKFIVTEIEGPGTPMEYEPVSVYFSTTLSRLSIQETLC
jgi:hypothetical protein